MTGKDHGIVTVLQECTENLVMNWRQTGFPILVAATNDSDRMPPHLLACFKHEVVFEVCHYCAVSIDLSLDLHLSRHQMNLKDSLS